MSDSIKKDDEKFNDLVSKQYFTSEGFEDSKETFKDSLEEDDAKMEDLMILQDISNTDAPLENLSIEDKYEVQIAVNEFVKKIDEQLAQNPDIDAFEQFFNDLPSE